MDQVSEGDAAIYDIFDDQQIGPLDGEIQILGDLDFARGGLAFSIAGDTHEIDIRVALQRARQVGHEETSAFQNANQVQVPVWVVAIDFGAHFAYTVADLFFGDKDAERTQSGP